MQTSAEELLARLLETKPRLTAEAPRHLRGLYGLVDHLGQLRYIGSTSSLRQNFYDRIHLKHRTGSENMSHYFSLMYNTGRMWRERNDPASKADGDVAKKLRNQFAADHCRAIWIPLPDAADIAQLEREVLNIAPDHAVLWNGRKTDVYDEPVDLVDATFERLGWGSAELAAIERQRQRFRSATLGVTRDKAGLSKTAAKAGVAPFPEGPFRFVALDVETANNDRGSICQIGVACVRMDDSIVIWKTYVDPEVDSWRFTGLHGIGAATVKGAPTFSEVIAVLRHALAGSKIYQHSGFDRSAISAACKLASLSTPPWDWHDSVQLARKAWPEFRDMGGHGLASLKGHLGLNFEHHDAGEDARAAAEVVLRAERLSLARPASSTNSLLASDRSKNMNCMIQNVPAAPTSDSRTAIQTHECRPDNYSPVRHLIGETEISQGNIDNDHIYLRQFFQKFPADAIGGSNLSLAARREVSVDFGGAAFVMTDLDGAKKLFRKRGWIREFFDRNSTKAGDTVLIEEVDAYSYRVSVRRR